MTYLPIPKNTYKLVADLWGCGDECCCAHTQIYAYFNHEDVKLRVTKLWEGEWFTSSHLDEYEVKELRREFKNACSKYNIDIDLSSNSPWDWKAQKEIS